MKIFLWERDEDFKSVPSFFFCSLHWLSRISKATHTVTHSLCNCCSYDFFFLAPVSLCICKLATPLFRLFISISHHIQALKRCGLIICFYASRDGDGSRCTTIYATTNFATTILPQQSVMTPPFVAPHLPLLADQQPRSP
ncbi:hypothetical protein Dimus_039721 [Dionaea muscipula]